MQDGGLNRSNNNKVAHWIPMWCNSLCNVINSFVVVFCHLQTSNSECCDALLIPHQIAYCFVNFSPGLSNWWKISNFILNHHTWSHNALQLWVADSEVNDSLLITFKYYLNLSCLKNPGFIFKIAKLFHMTSLHHDCMFQCQQSNSMHFNPIQYQWIVEYFYLSLNTLVFKQNNLPYLSPPLK